ncbi:MAG TPA: hypothetical protein VMZ27_12015 [Candidatus Saccharimonadales bacterium]|nr:hypothetical protein [Candidatus Saccharimonadales bacterium]
MKLFQWILILTIAWLVQGGSQQPESKASYQLRKENQVLKKLLAERTPARIDFGSADSEFPTIPEPSPKSRSAAFIRWLTVSSNKRFDPQSRSFMNSRGSQSDGKLKG